MTERNPEFLPIEPLPHGLVINESLRQLYNYVGTNDVLSFLRGSSGEPTEESPVITVLTPAGTQLLGTDTGKQVVDLWSSCLGETFAGVDEFDARVKDDESIDPQELSAYTYVQARAIGVLATALNRLADASPDPKP